MDSEGFHEDNKKALLTLDLKRGMEGFGAHSRMHTAKILRLSQDLPIIIEIVDTKEKIQSFILSIDDIIEEGLATIENIHIRFYRSSKKKA